MSGFTPSSFDARDYSFSAPAAPRLRSKLLRVPFVHDQREVPACVSVSIATCMEILDAKTPPAVRLAPLFNYFVTRDDPTELVDLEPRPALLAATVKGICRAGLHDVAYDAAGARTAPSAAAEEEALEHRIFKSPGSPHARAFWFERLSDADRTGEWRAALCAGLPVMFGFWLTPSYWAWRGQALPKLPRLAVGAEDQGRQGHFTVAIGFRGDDFVVHDSRGPSFASKGRWLLPRALLESALVVEAWAIRRITYD